VKRTEKIAFGCLGALFLACLATGSVFLFSDRAASFLGANTSLMSKGGTLTALDREFPFRPPEPAVVPKARIEAFLAVACATRPQADRLVVWVEANGRGTVMGQLVLPKEGAALMGEYLDGLTSSLKANRMSFAEFVWMGERLFLVSAGPPPPGQMEELQAALKSLREAEESTHRDHRNRRHLERQVALLEISANLWGPEAQADWEFYQRNLERLTPCIPSGAALRLVAEYYTPPPGTALKLHGEPLGALGQVAEDSEEEEEESPPPADTPLPTPPPPPAPKKP
jgi:hypothetical protein